VSLSEEGTFESEITIDGANVEDLSDYFLSTDEERKG